jgi:hypothetical protein
VEFKIISVLCGVRKRLIMYNEKGKPSAWCRIITHHANHFTTVRKRTAAN